jgi:Phosphoesterase family
VIPDKRWSDHSTETGPYGPSYVGDIVDAIGEGIPGSQCNRYTPGGGRFWKQEPTAIFILWDDWGGWFDHVPPPAVYTGTNNPPTCPAPAPNGWGCGYVYGFRVPLLVVSPYTGTPTQNGYTGYVSGACGGTGQPSCPNKVFPFVHDFGSILRFTELNFGLPNIDQSGKNGYADRNAPDNVPPNIPLSDFFGLSTKRDFIHISTDQPYTYFQSHSQYDPNWVPTGPDDDSEVD